MTLNCANCDSSLTELVYQAHEQDLIEQVWICEDCNAEFEAHFSLFETKLTDMGREMIDDE